MNDQQPSRRKRREWPHCVRLGAASLAACLVLITGALAYLYYNMSSVVIGLASRLNPALLLDLKSATIVTAKQIELRNLSLKIRGNKGQTLTFDKAVINFHWNGLWQRHIDSIRIDNPHIIVTDALLDAGERKASAKSSVLSPTGLWLVDAFGITGGKGEINLARMPVIRFEFESNLANVYLSQETRFSTGFQEVNLRNLELVGKDAHPQRFGTIKAVLAHFSIDQIARNKIDMLTIQGPSLWLTPALIRLFRASVSGNGAVISSSGTSPGSTHGTTVETPGPFLVGKFHLTDGEFFLSDFGIAVPDTSLKFAIEESDLQLGSNADTLAEQSHTAELWDIRVAAPFAKDDPFLWIGSAHVGFTAGGLFLRRQIEGVTITELDLLMGQKFRSFIAGTRQQSATAYSVQQPASGEPPWTLRALEIINGRATLFDLGLELPSIGFKLDTKLNNVALSKETGTASTDPAEVVISDLTIESPHDPFLPVLSFETIRLRFSLAQILDQQIDEVIFEKPTIFVGAQLFWYADELKRRVAAPAIDPGLSPSAGNASAPASNWRINKLSVQGGHLVVANAGHAGVTVPFEFSTEAENLRLNELSDLRLKMKLAIKKSDYLFPSYELTFKQLEGGIDFGLPPGSNAKNVYQKLIAAEARWKQFSAQKLWVFVTYDINGIYGKFGGAAYGGYLTGEFDFYMQPDTPWSGWVSGTKVNLKQLTDILAPQNFQMSGPAVLNIEVNGLNHQIERLVGNVKTKESGKLKIAKLDQIIEKIPSTWNSIKKGTARIMLETLRDFDYTSGNGDFWFAGDKGHLALKMQGPHGARNFDIAVHGE